MVGEGGRRERPARRREASPPRDGSILWVPVKLGLTGTKVAPAHDFYIAQVALREIQAQVAAPSEEEAAGILLGRVHPSSAAGKAYTVAMGVRRAARGLPEEAEVEEALRLLEPLCRAAEEEGETVVGWYHGHSLLGAFLSERDAGVHLRRFPEPGQFALVGVGDPERPLGGVFGRTEWGALLRGVYLPFHELLEEASFLEDGRKVTWLEWGNYRTEEAVVPAAKAGLAAPRQAVEQAVEQRAETPTRAERPSRDGPGAKRGPPLILPGELPAERAHRWGRRARRAGATLAAAALLGAGWLVWNNLSGPDSPLRTAAPSPPAEGAPAMAPADAALSGLSARLAEAAGAYRQRAGTFEAGRVGCDGLRPAYREVDGAFLALSERYVQAREELGEAGAAAYQAAARTMEEMDGHFDASGCPRPE